MNVSGTRPRFTVSPAPYQREVDQLSVVLDTISPTLTTTMTHYHAVDSLMNGFFIGLITRVKKEISIENVHLFGL